MYDELDTVKLADSRWIFDACNCDYARKKQMGERGRGEGDG